MTSDGPRVAVLGAGIMGACLALYLARRGAAVTLFDQATRPLEGASRWNEGKIHLGYLYSADASLRTARHVMPGGLLFRPLVEDLIAGDIAAVITPQDDLYLCHRDSVVPPEAMAAYMENVTALLREHPDARRYLADTFGARLERLDAAALAAVSGSPAIVAGFRVPERSVETTWIADRLAAALAAEPRIALHMATRVTAVAAPDGGTAGPWRVETAAGRFDGFGFVINALWEGRLAIDRTVGLAPPAEWSHRYRESLFLRTARPLDTPCAVIATGPFGDVKNYNGRDFYLSWYPDGLRCDSADVAPPEPSRWERPRPPDLAAAVLGHLQEHLPWIADIGANIERVHIGGGWVFAAGRGALSAPASSLHRRADYGVQRVGTYLSIDTGKYSTAPWLAREVAEALF